MEHWGWLVAAMLLTAGGSALAAPSLVEELEAGVYLVRDDGGQWGGDLSKSITHQVSPEYQAKKILDLSAVPTQVWRQTRDVRLSAYFMVRDYSWHDRPPANGLDEYFEVVVNGRVHRYPTDCGAPVFNESGAPSMGWYDLSLPKAEFVHGPNEIILRKAAGPKHDDYLYLGIDHTHQRGNSSVTFDGQRWTQEMLTIPGGNGEYMIRLYLLTRPLTRTVRWQPAATPALEDPARIIVYAGAHGAETVPNGLRLAPGQSARLEWHPDALDRLEPVRATLEMTGSAEIAWLDAKGQPAPKETGGAPLELAGDRRLRVAGLQVSAAAEPVVLQSITLEASRSYHPLPRPIDMGPPIAAPAGRPSRRPPSCRISDSAITLENAGMVCRFERSDRLRLTSLLNRHTACEMVRDPAEMFLFLVEVDGQRYAGSRDFRCVGLEPRGRRGFAARLERAQPLLRADLTVIMEAEGLRLRMRLANAGAAPVDFKLAFPHLAGLTVSGEPETDYYFFPWGGGIIADTPAIIRRGYGDHEALYQVMDLFSPQRGGGLYVRADDAEGWHKTLALRKYIEGEAEVDQQRVGVATTEAYRWTNPLEPVEGIGFAYEYLRRTRAPGEDFAPADAVLAAHPGDWHFAMRAYAEWAHRVWRFRPYPSRLKSVHHMIAAGWGQDVLFRDGKYRTDFIRPDTDCIELMSWWDWSPLGPWRTPLDRVREVLGEGLYQTWLPYFVKDPVTGQLMWNNQPGDYNGYNERFGGLPAFREAVRTYQQMGALVTLYTDPFRLDDGSKTGQAHGKEWGVVLPNGEHSKAYEVWNPCHDLPEVRQWVVDTMRRVMQETGADGIRLDEYGHKGWACFSTEHRHTFAERGVSQWQKAVAETTRGVRAAMDEVAPGSVLTTEHPGYDYLMPFIDGCITYDLTVQACPLRPLECNLQRFYFPECKAYELDHQNADPQDKKKLWNAVASFGRYYPPRVYQILKEHADVYQGGDAEPLIPTLRQFVYANCFRGGGKTIYHLYNATGHTVEGEVLRIPLRPEEHVVDLLTGEECPVRREGAEAVVSLYLPRDEVACLLRQPRRSAAGAGGAGPASAQ